MALYDDVTEDTKSGDGFKPGWSILPRAIDQKGPDGKVVRNKDGVILKTWRFDFILRIPGVDEASRVQYARSVFTKVHGVLTVEGVIATPGTVTFDLPNGKPIKFKCQLLSPTEATIEMAKRPVWRLAKGEGKKSYFAYWDQYPDRGEAGDMEEFFAAEQSS